MKKIGIMSMQRVDNYGSFLQAYALKFLILNNVFDCQVEFIDHIFEKSLVGDGVYTNKFENICKILQNPIIYIKKKTYLSNFHKAMSKYRMELGILEEYNHNKDVDFLVIGSDEVFNCMQPFPIGYSRNFYGHGYNNVISYAASFGHTNYANLQDKGINNEIGLLLKKMKAISVRDQNSFDLIKKLINVESKVNLDPVLVGDFNLDRIGKNPFNCEYIIVYAYTGRLSKSEESFIKRFSKDKNKIIVSIGNYQNIADYNIICHPLDVFSYFKYADYIITDTFHGTIFSIKTKSKFCTLVRDSNLSKLTFLLKEVRQEERIAKTLDDINRLYEVYPDYSDTGRVLSRERDAAIKYLCENLVKYNNTL